MLKSKKKGCADCKALRKNDEGYSCALGVNIEFSVIKVGEKTAPAAPVPAEKCFKPRTSEEYKQIKKKLKKKQDKEAKKLE